MFADVINQACVYKCSSGRVWLRGPLPALLPRQRGCVADRAGFALQGPTPLLGKVRLSRIQKWDRKFSCNVGCGHVDRALNVRVSPGRGGELMSWGVVFLS